MLLSMAFIDFKTRFILAFHLTKSRSKDSAITLTNEAKKGSNAFEKANNLISLFIFHITS
jgi:hypothetical protein